jgi:hypothetical protein
MCYGKTFIQMKKTILRTYEQSLYIISIFQMNILLMNGKIYNHKYKNIAIYIKYMGWKTFTWTK